MDPSGKRGAPLLADVKPLRARGRRWLGVLVVIAIVGAGAIWLTQQVRSTVFSRTVPKPVFPAAASSPREFPLEIHATAPAPVSAVAAPAVASATQVNAAAAAKPPLPPGMPQEAPATPSSGKPAQLVKPAPGGFMMLTNPGAGSGEPGVIQGLLGGASPGAPAAVATTPGREATETRKGALAELLDPTRTDAVRAIDLGRGDLRLSKGTLIECVLNTKLVSTVSGMTTCTVVRNVYSDTGKVVLIERGSQVTGEYGQTLLAGRERIYVLWDRLRTPTGVIVGLRSPASDELGAAGMPGTVDNHWFQRIGAALLLSVIQDAIDYKTAQQASRNGGNLLVMPNTSNQSEQLAGKVLDNTINIPPTLTREQGGRVGIMVARDLDFSSIYTLTPKDEQQ